MMGGLPRETDDRMRTLPRRAQLLLLSVCLSGLAAGAGAHFLPTPRADAEPWEILVFFLLGALAGSKKVNLLRHKDARDMGSMSLGFALTFAALLRFGPSGAVLIGSTATLARCL